MIERAVEASRRAVELAPLDMLPRGHEFYFLAVARRPDELAERCPRVAEVDSTHWLIATCRGLVHQLRGRLPEAIAGFEVAVERASGGALPLSDLAYAYAAAGRREDAERVIAHFHQRAQRQGWGISARLAAIHAAVGEMDEAFEWLGKACVERDPFLSCLKSPWLKPTRCAQTRATTIWSAAWGFPDRGASCLVRPVLHDARGARPLLLPRARPDPVQAARPPVSGTSGSRRRSS